MYYVYYLIVYYYDHDIFYYVVDHDINYLVDYKHLFHYFFDYYYIFFVNYFDDNDHDYNNIDVDYTPQRP